VTDSIAGTTLRYSYDSLNRLTEAKLSGTTDNKYTYDPDSNLTQQNLSGSITTAAYNTADQLCWTVTTTSANTCASPPTGAVTYTYDTTGLGNLTATSAGFAGSYNTKNQATSMTNPTGSGALTMTYAGTGSSVRTAAGTTSYTTAGGQLQASTTTGTTTYYTKEPTGQLTSLTVGTNTYYYLYDDQNNIIGLVDNSGTRVATYTYDPYGNTTATGTAAATNPWRYATGYSDPTGYTKFGTRYYNPATGTWTQPDPTGQTSGYTYAADDPANNSDPTGYFCLFGHSGKHGCAGGSITGGIASSSFAEGLDFSLEAGAAFGVGVLGSGAAIALAPETGGLSLGALPITGGAFVGSAALGHAAFRSFSAAF
jgi:RHS repeat-associated protein